MGILRAVLVILSVACLLAGSISFDVSARMEGRWALQAGNVLTGMDFSIQHPMAEVFHQQTENMSDSENLDMSFPILSDGVQLGPTAVSDEDSGDSASANILPMGDVNLAFPDTYQNSHQVYDATSTGFVAANWAYIADTAVGNQGSEPIGTHLASGHPFKSNKMVGSEFIWPSMTPIASAADGSLKLDADNLVTGEDLFATDLVPDVPDLRIRMNIPTTTNSSITAQSENRIRGNNTTSVDAGKQMPAGWSMRKPRVDPRMNKEQIKNTTDLQRMYRDAFVGSTMHRAYEGPTQYPSWIDPYDNGSGVFNVIDKQKILQVAMSKTKPGQHIAPVFWDL